MKVQKITTQPEFQPVTLQITIESKAELDLLKTLFATDLSVPRVLYDERYISREEKSTLSKLMTDMHEVLVKPL